MQAWSRFLDGQSLTRLSLAAACCAACGSLSFLGLVFCAGRLWAVIAVPVAACAAWLIFWSVKSAMECGIAADRWTDATRAEVKKRMGRLSLWLLPLWFAILTCNLVWTFGAPHRHVTGLMWMPLWMFSQALGSVQRLIAPPRQPQERTSLFANLKPLQSDHWGEGAPRP